MTFFGQIMLLLSLPGSLLLLWAAALAGRFRRSGPPAAGDVPPVTILKPLYGAEPRLADNLETFLRQDYAGAVQLIYGVHGEHDPAVPVVRSLQARHPDAVIELVIDSHSHGANGKISNLINMAEYARHDVIVMSDSDMAVPPAYLARIIAALEQPGVGAVSCLYRGRGDAGLWSRLVAMGIDLHFLPSALIGLALRLAHPCMGSTIALRRETLASIGGFPAFADMLADDHAIGAAVRARGLRVAIPDMLLTHGCSETTLGALLRQELRWNATILGIDPAGYAGSVLLHPLPLALVGGALSGFSGWALAAMALAFAVRTFFALRLGWSYVAFRHPRESGDPESRARRPIHWIPAFAGMTDVFLLVPLRDILSFLIFFAAFFTRSIDWRGARLRMEGGGRLSAEETLAP